MTNTMQYDNAFPPSTRRQRFIICCLILALYSAAIAILGVDVMFGWQAAVIYLIAFIAITMDRIKRGY